MTCRFLFRGGSCDHFQERIASLRFLGLLVTRPDRSAMLVGEEEEEASHRQPSKHVVAPKALNHRLSAYSPADFVSTTPLSSPIYP